MTRAALGAEWIKLRSTRSPYACLLSVAAVTLGLAAAVGVVFAEAGETPTRDRVLAGLLGYGLVIFMAMAGLGASGEYGTGTIGVTFVVLPSRVHVVAAKAAVFAMVCAVTAAVLTPLALLTGAATGGTQVDWSGSARLLWGAPLIGAITAVIAVALGFLLRRTAAVLTTVIIWPLLIEGLTTLIPKVGGRLATLMPFANAHLFLDDSQGLTFLWGPFAALAWFAGFAAVLLGLAMWSVNARDV
jgi:ABC-2 type transport system permease protein